MYGTCCGPRSGYRKTPQRVLDKCTEVTGRLCRGSLGEGGISRRPWALRQRTHFLAWAPVCPAWPGISGGRSCLDRSPLPRLSEAVSHWLWVASCMGLVMSELWLSWGGVWSYVCLLVCVFRRSWLMLIWLFLIELFYNKSLIVSYFFKCNPQADIFGSAESSISISGICVKMVSAGCHFD